MQLRAQTGEETAAAKLKREFRAEPCGLRKAEPLTNRRVLPTPATAYGSALDGLEGKDHPRPGSSSGKLVSLAHQ